MIGMFRAKCTANAWKSAIVALGFDIQFWNIASRCKNTEVVSISSPDQVSWSLQYPPLQNAMRLSFRNTELLYGGIGQLVAFYGSITWMQECARATILNMFGHLLWPNLADVLRKSVSQILTVAFINGRCYYYWSFYGQKECFFFHTPTRKFHNLH